ncbi:hypothetical protein COEREDRAFT_15775 [Coemansia reversa NRRL 1564]|uniref:Uncharacterized protein n=1 Tax=Coemansia reversa (strain ATCC 12441 / NRRL 1564) TaxID=763665 RepID=A0A2G5BA90_COERN|nr:hypothetical protein COEREDRAFT_15775 [Coemansia reversa NRRL 1564]|eukprot:PIA15925.1 hypothetical protein COEREDRAFT_15775 [Coemansia reversa NRRL 1564]
MRRIGRWKVGSVSTVGRLRMLQQMYPSAAKRSEQIGRNATLQIKLAAKQKVAWREGSMYFIKYSELLAQALMHGSIDRLELLLRRIRDDRIRTGNPTGIRMEQLDQCAADLLNVLLGGSNRVKALVASETLAEIARHMQAGTGVLLSALGAVRSDINGNDAARTQYVDAVVAALCPTNFDLLRSIVGSAAISAVLVTQLHERIIAQGICIDAKLAAAFYCAALHRGVVPSDISKSLTKTEGTGDDIVAIRQIATARTHQAVVSGDGSKLDIELVHAKSMAGTAQWPLGAMSEAVRLLIAKDKHNSAERLLAATGVGDRLLFEKELLDVESSEKLGAALLEDELTMRLQRHQLYATKPLKLFAPQLELHFNKRAQKLFAAYVRGLARVVSGDSMVAVRATAEICEWTIRLKSSLPMTLFIHALRSVTKALDEDTWRELLAQLTRVLYNSRVPVLRGFDSVRRVLLRETLRRGITPTPSELALWHGYLTSSGHTQEAMQLAPRILPLLRPQDTAPKFPNNDTVQAFYENLMHALPARRALQLADYVLSHHGVPMLFRRRILDNAVVISLQARLNTGFYGLERLFLRHATSQRFTKSVLNVLLPRFWSLHMFLRRNKHVPRLRLHCRQIYKHRHRVFAMRPTAVPSLVKRKAQKIDMSTVPMDTDAVRIAIDIYLHSRPPPEPSTATCSIEHLLNHKTHIIGRSQRLTKNTKRLKGRR